MTTISKSDHDRIIMQVRGQCGLDCSTDSALVGNLKDALHGRDTRIEQLEKQLKEWDQEVQGLQK